MNQILFFTVLRKILFIGNCKIKDLIHTPKSKVSWGGLSKISCYIF